MSVINESLNLGDLLKYEEGRLNYSREQETVTLGQTLEIGSVVGRIAATGKLVRLDPLATDGSEIAAGILLVPCDASLIERGNALMLARHGIVASNAIVWPAAITPEHKVAATNQLELRGILIRQSA
jgi:hypothetical protein